MFTLKDVKLKTGGDCDSREISVLVKTEPLQEEYDDSQQRLDHTEL